MNFLRKIILLVLILKTVFVFSNNNIDSLINLYNSLSLQNADDSLLFDISYNISHKSVNPDIILFYAKKAYEHASATGNDVGLANSMFMESTAYLRKSSLDSSIMSILNAKEIYRVVGSEEGISLCLFRLGDIYRHNNEFEKSEFQYLSAIDMMSKLNDKERLAASYINLGELFRIWGKYDEAFKYFNIADSICQKINHQNFSAYAKGNIGLVLIAQNLPDSAEVYLNKSIEVLNPLNDNYAVSCYLDGLAEVYFKRGQNIKALETSLRGLELAKEYGLKEQIRDANLKLSKIYKESKDFEKALHYHMQYVAYRDTINNEETIRNIANIKTQYEVAKKQKEVEKETAKKNRYLILAIVAICVLVVITILSAIILKISRERRKINLILEKQHKELDIANQTKNKFFSILSHDLRSPLATFYGVVEVMDLCVHQKEYTRLVEISEGLKSSSSGLLDLLDNLLQWGINQMGADVNIPTWVNVKEVVNTEKMHLHHVADKKRIKVDVNIEDSITVFVDRVKLSVAIRNLLNNAIKFTPLGGKVSIDAVRDCNKVKLRISDTGVGMTHEQSDNLFDFSEIKSTYGTLNEKGVGLGMQLVDGFVKESNAGIEVESELGKGTSFVLTFPELEVDNN